MIVAKTQHFVDKELKREVAGRRLQVRLNLVLFVFQRVLRVPFTFNVDSFDGSHCEEKIFNEECFLDVNGELTERFGAIVETFALLGTLGGGVFHKARILFRDVVMIKMWTLEEPVG